MQNDLLWRIAEVHIVEHHVARELCIGHGAVRLMRMLPRPHAGALLALGQRAVRMLDRVDKGHIASSVSDFSSSSRNTRSAPAMAITTEFSCWLTCVMGWLKLRLSVMNAASVPSVRPT